MIGGLLKSTSSAALFAALGLVALGGVTSARAADLGGDCCADLEERVAELEATSARKGNRKVSLTITGQVTTEVMAWDAGAKIPGGNRSGTYVVDNVAAGGSFFSFQGDAKINPKLTAGFNITMALDTGGRSHQVSQKDDDGQGQVPTSASSGNGAFEGGYDTFVVMTLANWYLDHKDLGRITVGRINTATAGLTTIDLGGAGVIANANWGYWQRSFIVPGSPAGGQTWNTLTGGGSINGSGLSRANAISYQTPTFAGFSASVAWGEQDLWDAAVRYAGEFSGFRLAAGFGYAHNAAGLGDFSEEYNGTTVSNFVGTGMFGAEPNQWKGSASILNVATGLYLTGAYVKQENDNNLSFSLPDTTMYYVQGGISKNWTGLGNTTLYGEYIKVHDGIGASTTLGTGLLTLSDTRVWGVGIVQTVDAAAMDLFLSYRNYDNDFATDQFNVVVGGARIKF